MPMIFWAAILWVICGATAIALVLYIRREVAKAKTTEKQEVTNSKTSVIISAFVIILTLGGMYWQIQLEYPIWKVILMGLFALAMLGIVWRKKRI